MSDFIREESPTSVSFIVVRYSLQVVLFVDARSGANARKQCASSSFTEIELNLSETVHRHKAVATLLHLRARFRTSVWRDRLLRAEAKIESLKVVCDAGDIKVGSNLVFRTKELRERSNSRKG